MKEDRLDTKKRGLVTHVRRRPSIVARSIHPGAWTPLAGPAHDTAEACPTACLWPAEADRSGRAREYQWVVVIGLAWGQHRAMPRHRRPEAVFRMNASHSRGQASVEFAPVRPVIDCGPV